MKKKPSGHDCESDARQQQVFSILLEFCSHTYSTIQHVVSSTNNFLIKSTAERNLFDNPKSRRICVKIYDAIYNNASDEKIVWLLEPMNVVLLNYHDNEHANDFHNDYVTFKDAPRHWDLSHVFMYI